MIISYKTEIVKYNYSQDLKNTITIYRKAVSYICDVIYKEWDNISKLSGSKGIYNYIEHLIHNTKDNKATYDFDTKFYKFPSYFRRDAISLCYGHISSYMSNLDNYNKKRYEHISNGLKFKEKAPKLQLSPNIMPTFYKDNMYTVKDGHIFLKVYKNKDWKYVPISLRKNDTDYINKNCSNMTVKNPSLVYEYNKYYLRYAFETKGTKIKEKPVNKKTILSVDLGVNTDATCSVIDGKGTIIARHFIKANDKDLMYHLLNRKKKLQFKSGNYKYAPLKKITTKINGYNDNIENQVSHKIISLALMYEVDVIVFEKLSPSLNKGSEKIHYWRKKAIIHKVCNKIHMYGIRYATINPKNTSALAYDGTGPVLRNKDNYSLCTFTTGKRYNSDLNASYNIAARYFIREYKKTIPEMEWSVIEAKVPSLQRRTDSTFNSFKELLKVV